MGRMIYVVDLSAGTGGSKLLTDKAHGDGSPSCRGHPDNKNHAGPPVVLAEKKQVSSEHRKCSSTKTTGGMSMKMRIAPEMSKEIESKRKQPNVVARLMGLDEGLPAHQSTLNTERCLGKNDRSSCVSLARALQLPRQHEDGYLKVHSCAHKKECRDIYEVWQQPAKTNHFMDHTFQKGRRAEIQDEMRMALVRQKFVEAKRLATDERLLQSKEFQEALEVLSSNRDLFIRFLEEPNSIFSMHLKELHSTPAAPQTKRITVLKPLRTVETKQQYPVTQPTRIVVLKPRPEKHNETKTIIKDDALDQDSEAAESVGCREIANNISRQMMYSVSSNRRDESLLSSVLSNGYVGDESSFNRSDNEVYGKFSDYEIASPISRHSWDYSNRFGSPYSLSSFNRATNSPEPSVIREAKKRLSERWFMMASSANNREHTGVQRSSRTLGEMLATSEIKTVELRTRNSHDGEGDLRVSSARSPTCQTKVGDHGEKTPCNLSWSKSIPVSSTYKNIGLNEEVPSSQVTKPVGAKDVTKSKSGRSSFKGKVSSLLFSRSKKGGTEKSLPSPGPSSHDKLLPSGAEPAGEENVGSSNPDYIGQPEDSPPLKSENDFPKASSTTFDGLKQGSISFKDILSLEKSNAPESVSDASSSNQSQPSPTSVLDAPFEDDTSNSTPDFSELSNARPSMAPIESVARTLFSDDSNTEVLLRDTSKLSRTLPMANAEEQQRFFSVRNILSSACLDNEKLDMVFSRWHSIDSPLDPSLLDKFLDRKEEDAKSRERRSNQRLVFDWINFALLEIGRTVYLGAYPWVRLCSMTRKKPSASAYVGDEVWVLTSDRLSTEAKLESCEADNNGRLVDGLLRNEVVGIGWLESMLLEIDEISNEIGGAVLEKLIEEALADLAVECLLRGIL